MAQFSLSEFAKGRGRDGHGAFVSTKRTYDWLLEFESVKTWINNYTAPNTRRNYLTGLSIACRRLNLNPDEILALARGNGDKFPRDLKTQFKNILNEYTQGGKLGEAKKLYAALRSFLLSSEVTVTFTKQERVHYKRKKAAHEKILIRDEIYRLVDAVGKVKGWGDPLKKLRAKALILCAFQSGVRPGCLVRWHYGLVKPYLFPKIRTPVPLKITSTLDTKLLLYDLEYYMTFLAEEAAQALKEYLEARMNRGETLTDSSPIFVTYANNSRGEPLDYTSYFRILKRTLEAAGLEPEHVWPHLLRKSFKKVLNKADMDDDTREALMGHRIPGSRENYFDRHDLGDVTARYAKANFSREEPAGQPAQLDSKDLLGSLMKAIEADPGAGVRLLRALGSPAVVQGRCIGCGRLYDFDENGQPIPHDHHEPEL